MTNDLVNIFNSNDEIIVQKTRSEIDKISDILEVVFVRIFVEDKILLSRIVQKDLFMNLKPDLRRFLKSIKNFCWSIKMRWAEKLKMEKWQKRI